ncbi:hypothetical protein PoB_004273500 [Plakobranchus ocellatus]|uniref:Uncharacterized protein n=1 Tax=Plakobranchus ocellatus TaxID=259542 RepID=A0AAV4BAV7_9GAST|nr:hypothetical protein PoB_004273500 [Plakobranchus ocellatus]
MASTLLKLGVLVVCFSFVLSASVEDEKSRWPRFFKIFRRKDKPTIEEQAEKVVEVKTRVSQAADQLTKDGKSLQTYGKSLQDDLGNTDEDFKACFDVLDQLGSRAARAGEIITKTNEDIHDALTNKKKDVGDVVQSSQKEVSDLEKFMEQTIDDAKKAALGVYLKLDPTMRSEMARKIMGIDDIFKQVVNSLDEVGEDSVDLDKKVGKEKKDMSKVLRQAGERVAQAVAAPKQE